MKESPSNVMILRSLTTRRDKVILFALFLATIVLSLIETIGISIIMPFITFASNPQMIFSHWSSAWIYEKLNLTSTMQFMYVFSFALIAFYFFSRIL